MTPWIVPHLWWNEMVARRQMGSHLSKEENNELEKRTEALEAEQAQIVKTCEEEEAMGEPNRRSPIERMVDEACGYEPPKEPPPPPFPHSWLCACGVPGGTRAECRDERGIKTPCRCACHSKDNEDRIRAWEDANP